jgi:uncharacterized protein YbaP (TraB family)
MINKFILVLVAALFVFPKVNAQQFQEKDNSLLWRINSKNSDKVTYLVFTTGSLEVVNPGLITKVSHVLADIKVYYSETGLSDPENNDVFQKFAFIKKPEESVTKSLSKTSMKDLNLELAKIKIPEEIIIRLVPAAIPGMLTQSATANTKNINLIENTFRAYAKQLNLPVKTLITLDESYKFVNDYGRNYYLKLIEYQLQNKKQIIADLHDKAAFYTEEDIAGIQKLYAKSSFLSYRYTSDAIEKSKISLIAERIDEVVKTGGALITIDVINMMNPNKNIISELEKIGYTFTPIKD